MPAVDRETTSLADKEAAAEFAFMLESVRMKNWAAEGDNLQLVLARADNSAFTNSFKPTHACRFARGGFDTPPSACRTLDGGSGPTPPRMVMS